MARALTDTEAERLADARRWLADNKFPGVLPKNDTKALKRLDATELEILRLDPSGLPARCELPSCRRRLPMCQRSDRWHPKCEPVF